MKRKIKTYTTKTLLFLKSRRHLYSIGLDGTLRLRLPYNNKLIFLKLVHFSYCSTILSLRTENATFLFRARGTRQQLKSKPNRYPIVNCCTLRWWIRLIDGIMEYDSFFFLGGKSTYVAMRSRKPFVRQIDFTDVRFFPNRIAAALTKVAALCFRLTVHLELRLWFLQLSSFSGLHVCLGKEQWGRYGTGNNTNAG